MIPVNRKIIVAVDMKQKDKITVGGVTVSTAMKYEVNYREKSPVVAEVVEGNRVVRPGQILVCHHNMFYPPSPYFLQDNLFSIPFSNIIFAVVTPEGALSPICGHLICERVYIPSEFPLPPEQRKLYIDRAIVVDPGATQYKKGQLIFHRKNAGYEIVYTWNEIEKRATKVHEDQICAVVK